MDWLTALLDALDGIAYAIDDDDRIIAVGPRNWDRFAQENGAPELISPHILGRPLFDGVAGDDVRAAYQRLKGKVLASGEPSILTARCDAPDIARELRIAVGALQLPAGKPGLLFQSLAVSETVRPPIDLFDFKSLSAALSESSALPIVTMCSFCQRILASDRPEIGDWVTAEQYYRAGGTSRVRISHGLCQVCCEAQFP